MLIGRSERQSRKSVRIYLLISHHIWLRHFTNSIVLQRRPKRYAEICLITRNRVTRLTPILIDKIARLLIFSNITRARANISPRAQDHARKQAHHKLLYIARARNNFSKLRARDNLHCARGTISPNCARAGQFLQNCACAGNIGSKLRVRGQHWVEIARRRSPARGTNFPVWASGSSA